MLAEYLRQLEALGAKLEALLATAFEPETWEPLLLQRADLIQKMAALPASERQLNAEQLRLLQRDQERIASVMTQVRQQQQELLQTRQELVQEQDDVQRAHRALLAYQGGETPPAQFIEEES